MGSIFAGTEIVQYLAVFFGSLNVISSGMVYGWPSATLPHLLNPLSNNTAIHLTPWQGTWLAIAPFFGALLTVPLSFSAASIIGPKRAIMFSFYPYLASWIFISAANTFEVLLFARLLAGISDSCIYTSFPIYIDDVCNCVNTKRKYYSLYPISFAIGILLINFIASFHSLFETAVIASIIILLPIGSLALVPESPYFLLSRNQLKQAREALRFSRSKEDIDEEYEKLKDQVLSRGDSELDLGKVFSAPIRTNLAIGLTLVSAQQLAGITPIIFFINTVLGRTDYQFSFDTSLSLIMFCLLLAMAIFSSLITDAKSGKNVLLYSLMISAVALISLGFYFQSVSLRMDSSILSTIPIAALLIYIIFYGLGLQNIPYIYMNRMYSRNIKSKCLALIYVCYSVIAASVTVFFTWLNCLNEIYLAFYLFGACCLACFTLIWYTVPKCKDWCEEAQCLLSSHTVGQDYQFLLSSFELSDFSE